MSENIPQWIKDQIREQQIKMGLKKGRGGKRPGAGRPKQYYRLTIVVRLDRIKRMNLEEMGEGEVQKGVQKLIDQYV